MALATSTFASTGEVISKEVKVFQCGELVQVKNKKGEVIYTDMFISNAKGADCTKAISDFQDSIEALYPMQRKTISNISG